MGRNFIVVCCFAFGLLLPTQAGGASVKVDSTCKSAAYGSTEVLASINVQNTIAEGRTSIDFVAYFTVNGTVTATATDSAGTVLGADSVTRNADNWFQAYVSAFTGLPASGDITITATFAPSYAGYVECTPMIIMVKRAEGLVLLGKWSSAFLGRGVFGYETSATKQSQWQERSCQTLAVLPIKVMAQSSGIAGAGKARMSIADQCDLVAPTKVKKEIKVPGGKVTTGKGSIIVRSTLRKDGEQDIGVTITIGKTNRTLKKQAFFTPSSRIWEGTDAFWNICLADSKTIYSEGGRLYCNRKATLLF